MASPDNVNPDRLEVLFDAALQITSATERSAFLDRECAGDDALRRRVEALLRAAAKAGDFLPEKAALPGTVRITIPDEEKLGTLIGRYKLLEKVGEGGFGAVYVAEQREPVKRRVALKIIKLGMDTKEVVARFEAERQALAMMDHPNIAKVLDAGATESGRPYFVMELVRGIRITDYCEQNQLATLDRLKLFIQVCNAVQHAHQKGIIHRDLKPSNILVTLHDGVPVPKVIDFGIAKATQQELTDKTVYTQLQQFIGTPAYISPEQAEMSGLDIDTRSDIYSLGVLLYELLTGQTPFDARELLKAGLDHLRRTIREVEPLRPSTRLTQELARFGARAGEQVGKRESVKGGGDESPTFPPAHSPPRSRKELQNLQQLISLVRGDLDWIVMKALEKDRTRRYETANALAADLNRHLTNEPVIARPPSMLYRLQKMARRNKLAFAAASAVVTALILGISVSAWQAVRANRETAAARKAQALAQYESERADTNAASASAAKQTALSRLAQLSVKDGWRRAEEGDYLGALQPFVEAWQIEGSNAPNAELHRLRLASLLQQCPKLVNVTPLATNLSIATFSRERTRFVTAQSVNGSQAFVQVWEVATGRALTLPAQTAGEVKSISWSHSGNTFLIESSDSASPSIDSTNNYAVWNAGSGQPVSPFARTIRGTGAAINGDGSRLAVRHESRTELIDLVTGKTIWTHLPDYPDGGRSGIAVRPDGRLVFAGNEMLDGITGRRMEFLQVTNVSRLTINSDGEGLIAVGDDSEGREIEVNWVGQYADKAMQCTNCIILRNMLPPLLVGKNLPLLNSDSSLLATVDEKGNVWLSDPTKAEIFQGWNYGTVASRPMPVGGEVLQVVFSPDSAQLATVSRNLHGKSVIRVWDTKTAEPLTPLLPQSGPVLTTFFNDDGTRLFVVTSDGILAEWDLRTSKTPRFTWPQSFGEWTENSLALGISPDGRWLAANQGYSDVSKLGVWNLEKGEFTMGFLPIHLCNSTLRFTRDGSRLCVGGQECVHVWNVGTGKPITSRCSFGEDFFGIRLMAQDRFLSHTDVSQDGERVVHSNGEVIETETGKVIAKLNGFTNEIISPVAFSPDGQWVLGRSYWATTFVWKVTDPNPVMRLALPRSRYTLLTERPDVHQTPDGKWHFLVGATWPPTLSIWNPDTRARSCVDTAGLNENSWRDEHIFSRDNGALISLAQATASVTSSNGEVESTFVLQHRGRINRAGFSPDNRFIATASNDKTVRIWDAKTGEPLALFPHRAPVIAGQFSPDGKSFAAWDKQGIYYWQLPSDNRSLNEWQQLAALFSDSVSSDSSSNAPSFYEAWLALRTRRPADFTVTDSQIDSWHRAEAVRAEAGKDWSNVVRHLTWLMERHPASVDFAARRGGILQKLADGGTNEVRTQLLKASLADYDKVLAWLNQHPEISTEGRASLGQWREGVFRKLGMTNEAREAMLSAKGVPPRPANLGPNQIDLGDWYNWNTSELRPDNVAIFHSIQFDVRASVRLAGGAHEDRRKEILGIKAGVKCRKLHFLHTASTANETLGLSISKFVMHFSNGETRTREIRLGDDVWDSIVPPGGPKPLTKSRVVWTGPNHPKEPNGKQAQVFLTTWENPFPDLVVESIDFISALNEPTPYLYAITAEP